MYPILAVPLILSLIFSALFMPLWIRKARQIGLVWRNMNQYGNPQNLIGSGGIVVLMAFIIGVLSYVAIKTFVLRADVTTVEIFALLTMIIMASVIGFVDDLLSWAHGGGGLSALLRVFLMFMAAIPLMVINAGHSTIQFPFFGNVDIAILYPLLLIPIAVVGAGTTFNFLAGMNGLESGQGIIILSFLSCIAYLTGSSWLALIGACMVISLIVFFWYNKYPAKILPGDVLTYAIGTLIAGMAILGNFERIAIFVFIPYMLEVILKLRGRLKKQSFGIAQKDGSLELPYDKIYSLTHLSMFVLKKLKKKVYERDVVHLIFAVQIIVCLLSLLLFRGQIFA